MGKTKRAKQSQVEFLLDEINRLEKENSQLKQELKRVQARASKLKKDKEAETKQPKADGCPKCGKTIKPIPVPHGKLYLCKNCNFKKVIK